MIAYLMVALVGVMVMCFCFVVARALRQWQGLWRWVAGVPVLIIVAVALNIVSAIRIDATAHNLWPLELLAWLALATAFMGILYLAHWITSRPSRT
jgi:hypothetical protein